MRNDDDNPRNNLLKPTADENLFEISFVIF